MGKIKKELLAICFLNSEFATIAEIVEGKLMLSFCHKGQNMSFYWEFEDTKLRNSLHDHFNKKQGKLAGEIMHESLVGS